MKILLSLLILLFAVPADAQLMIGGGRVGAAINGFSYCREVRVDHTKVSNTVFPAADLSNFPVLFDSKINAGLQADLKLAANGGFVTDAQGDDISFFPDALGGAGGAEIDPDPRIYNGTTGEFIAYLRRDLSHTVDTLFWICYGKAAQTSRATTASNVWHSSYKAVWGFGDGTTLSLLDSTANASNGTNTNGVTAVPGKVGGAAHFTRASNQYIALGNPAGQAGAMQNSRTVEFWYHLDTAPPATTGSFMIYHKIGEDGGMGFYIKTPDPSPSNDKGVVANFYSGAQQGAKLTEDTLPMAGDTKKVSLVYNRAIHTMFLYINCALVRTYDYWPGLVNIDNNAYIGGASASLAMDGWVDELTISNVARPHDYVVAGCLIETNPSLMVSVGPRL